MWARLGGLRILFLGRRRAGTRSIWEGSRIAAGVERLGEKAVLVFVALQSRLRCSVVFCGRNKLNMSTILSFADGTS